MGAIEVVYLGHDNTIDLVLKKNGVPDNLSTITKVEITIGATVINSVANPLAFDLSKIAIGTLVLKLGDQPIPSGNYSRCEIVVFDATRPGGLVWGAIGIIVK